MTDSVSPIGRTIEMGFNITRRSRKIRRDSNNWEGRYCMNIPKSLRLNGTHMVQRQAMIWPNISIVSIRSVGKNFNEILIGTHTSSLK